MALIHTSEDCYPLVNYAINALKDRLTNYTSYKFIAERYFDYTEVRQIISNLSLFGEKNYIEINYKTKPTLEQQSQLLSLLNTLDTNTLLLITTDKLNKKEITTAWIEKINDLGVVLSLSPLDAKIAVNHQLHQAKLNIESKALDFLLELNQFNLGELFQEINKITWCYPEGTTLTIADMQQIDNSQYNVYQLSNAYLAGDLKRSLKILDNLHQAPEDAILIMWMISEDLRKLIKLKAKLKQNLNSYQALQELKVWGEAVTNLTLAEKRLSYTKLLQLFDNLTQVDLIIKGVIQGTVKQQLTQILLNLCILDR